MTSRILTFRDGPNADETPTLRPLTEEDLQRVPNGTPAPALVLHEWPAGPVSQGSPEQAFERWLGPILIAPEDDVANHPPNLARIILASTDAGEIRELSEWARELAEQARSRLLLLVVLDHTDDQSSPALKRAYEEAQRQLAQLVARLRTRGIRANWEVRFGSLGEETARLAATTGTNVAAVCRPAPGESARDFEQFLDWVHENRPAFHILVSPPRG